MWCIFSEKKKQKSKKRMNLKFRDTFQVKEILALVPTYKKCMFNFTHLWQLPFGALLGYYLQTHVSNVDLLRGAGMGRVCCWIPDQQLCFYGYLACFLRPDPSSLYTGCIDGLLHLRVVSWEDTWRGGAWAHRPGPGLMWLRARLAYALIPELTNNSRTSLVKLHTLMCRNSPTISFGLIHLLSFEQFWYFLQRLHWLWTCRLKKVLKIWQPHNT